MSFTLDDSDPSLAYSADGWAVQPPGDPQLGEFFQRTYHAAQQDGATLKFQFSGTAFAIYGSKGPGHALYRVQADNVVVNLDASAPQTEFQQELVTHTFDQSGVHTVTLTALLSGVGLKGKWLDVDYITFTTTNGSTVASPNIATVTSTPPWFSDSSQTNAGASSTGLVPFNRPSSTSTPSSAKSSNVPTILAILFGALIALGLAVLALYLVLRRISARHRARERAFRYGQSSANPSASLAGTAAYAHSLGASTKDAAPSSHSYAFTGGAVPPGAGGAPSQRSAGHYSNGHGSLASNMVEMRAVSASASASAELLRENAGSPAVSAGTGRPTVSSSPIAWTRQKVGGGHRGDADSLRTDFLQV